MAAQKLQELSPLITLIDEEGNELSFKPLELFTVGKKYFALLQPTKGPRNELTVLKFLLGKKGLPKVFEVPTENEFQAAVEALGAQAPSGCECECASDCGCGDQKKPARKPAPKPAPKKKAKPKAARR
ncbi:MAG: DUF1292 domain-containing protein [Deltaproteobacteria bacterium]|nr:DUF1292 domain-containing protein [Deltaproteobacteria bacterium]